MPLYPVRGETYTPEEYVQDIIDGRLAIGNWSKSGNTYNVKIEFDRMSTADQKVTLELLADSPEATDKFYEIEDTYYRFYAEHDNRNTISFLNFVNYKDGYSEYESSTELQSISPEQPYSNYSKCTQMGFSHSMVNPNPICLNTFNYYSRLPLELHKNYVEDHEQLSPRSADSCGKDAFNSIYKALNNNNTVPFERINEAYQNCEYAYLDQLDFRNEMTAFYDYIVEFLGPEYVEYYDFRPEDMPTGQLKQLIADGWHTGLISYIKIGNDIIQIHLTDSDNNETSILAFNLISKENQELKAAQKAREEYYRKNYPNYYGP